MKSLQRQLTWLLLGFGPGLLTVGFLLLYLLMRKELYEQFDDGLRTACGVIAEEIQNEVGSATHARLREELGELEANDLVPRYFEVATVEGERLAASAILEDGSARARLPTVSPAGRAVSVAQPDGRPGRALSERFAGGAMPFQVTVVAERADLDEALRAALLVCVATGAGMGLLALVAVPWFLRRLLDPLHALNRSIAAIDAESLDRHLEADAMPAELRPVVERLNAMLGRLAESFARERRVNADLAHELRTPVAELRLLAESALKWPAARDARTDEETLAIARQMETMVERMLTLARSEEGRLVGEAVATDLDDLIANTLRHFTPAAESRGLEIDLQGAAGTVHTDPALLRSILNNLFDNATSYAPPGSRIGIRVEREGAHGFAIEVDNDAPELTDADLSHLGSRYWRKRAARGGNHLGIGASLVHSFSLALGGRATFLLAAGRLTVRLQVPGERDASSGD